MKPYTKAAIVLFLSLFFTAISNGLLPEVMDGFGCWYVGVVTGIVSMALLYPCYKK